MRADWIALGAVHDIMLYMLWTIMTAPACASDTFLYGSLGIGLQGFPNVFDSPDEDGHGFNAIWLRVEKRFYLRK